MKKRKHAMANLTSISEPRFLTLTKSPANRASFKVIRGDYDAKTHPSLRNDRLVYLELPDGIDEATARAVMEDFGLEEDYELEGFGNSYRLVRKRGNPEDVPTVAMNLGGGLYAHVERSEGPASDNTSSYDQEKSMTTKQVKKEADKSANAKTTDTPQDDGVTRNDTAEDQTTPVKAVSKKDVEDMVAALRSDMETMILDAVKVALRSMTSQDEAAQEEPCQVEIGDTTMTLFFPSGNRMSFSRR